MVKKGRHRRYEEARRFNRDNAESSFNIEEFDLDAPDPFALLDIAADDDADDDQDERTAALTRQYGMVDDDQPPSPDG